MSETPHPIAELLRQDKRYKFEAYAFVFEALNYAHEVLGMGKQSPGQIQETPRRGKATRPGKSSSRKPTVGKAEPAEDDESAERHLTGQELCEAIRLYALEQFGYMAKCVLNSWGVQKTGDFGEIVFNLIRIGQMRKTSQDRREDFDDVFDFEAGLRQSFQIKHRMSRRKNRTAKDRTAAENPNSSRAEVVESVLPQPHPPRRRPWFLALTSIALGLWLLFLFFVALQANR